MIDPSPLKEGQKVSVLWGKTKKEFSAVVECYPVQPVSREPSSQESLAPRKAKAKRRLVRKLPIKNLNHTLEAMFFLA